MKNNFISSHPPPVLREHQHRQSSAWVLISVSFRLRSLSASVSPFHVLMFCDLSIRNFSGRGEANSGINTLGTRSKTIQQLISCVDPWVFSYIDSIWHKFWNNFLSAALRKINLAKLVPLSLLSGVHWSRKREHRQQTRQSDGRTTWKSRRLTTSRSDSIWYRLLCYDNNYIQLQTESDWSGRVRVNLISQTVVNSMCSLKASSPARLLLLTALLISGA